MIEIGNNTTVKDDTMLENKNCLSQITACDVLKVKFLNEATLVEDMTNSVYDVDYGKDGKLYVADFRNNRVQVLDNSLNEILVFENIPSPHGVAVGDNGFLYIAGYRSGRVHKFSFSGKEEKDWDDNLRKQGKIKNPLSVDIDQENNVYIADYELQSILKVKEDGVYSFAFDTSSIVGPDKKFLPHGIVTDGVDYLYVADRGECSTIHVFELDGKYVTSWVKPVREFDPLAVCFIGKSLLLVPNYKDSKLYLFDLSGKNIGVLGNYGNNPAEFLYVANLTTDEKGNMYVVEENGNRIQKINCSKIIEYHVKK